MDDIFSIPGDIYRYIDGQFGTIGLIVAGVMVVVAIVFIFIFFDRRK